MQHNPLPSNLVLAKPKGQDSYKPEVLQDLEDSGRLIGTRKRDGHKVLAEVCEGGRVRFYRAGMDEVDHRLDFLREEIRGLRLPVDTVLVGELIVERKSGEDMGAVTSILGGTFATAQAALARGPLPTFVVFNALHGGKLVAKPYGQTLPWLHELLKGGHYVVPVDRLEGTVTNMNLRAAASGWEGLVLYDPDYVLTWRLGKTEPRPSGCYKLKLISEDDFIIFARDRRFQDGQFKDVLLLQWDPVERKLFACGHLGTFNAETKAILAADHWDVKVMQVRYVRRYDKSGKLREPAFMRLRDDKNPDNCIAPRAWPEAEYRK